MKANRILISFISLSFAMWSCSEIDTRLQETYDELSFVNVNLPDEVKLNNDNLRISEIDIDEEILEVHAKGSDGEIVIGFIKFIIPDLPDEKLIGVEVTQNILNLTTLDEDFLLNLSLDFNSNENARIQSSCVASCHSTFTDGDGNKIKGRGSCKAQCWAGAVATVAAALIIALL